MAESKKKKSVSLSPQERAAQRERRLENDRKAAEQIRRRAALLRSIPGLTVMAGSFSMIPVHLGFYAPDDITLFVRGFSDLTKVRKGDLIQISCVGEPRSDRPCVAKHNDRCVIAVRRGEQGNEFFNLSSRRREDDIIRVDDSNYIGMIQYILEAPESAGVSGKDPVQSVTTLGSPAGTSAASVSSAPKAPVPDSKTEKAQAAVQ